MANSYDIIVIGGSVNGLVAAAYLARAGQRVLVLEQRGDIGGTFVTEDAFPGFRFNTVVHDVGWLSPRIVQDLELARHGLDLIRPDVTVLMPLPDGGGLALWRDIGKSVEAIRRFSRSDAEKWPTFSERLGKLAGFLETVYATTIPSIATTSLSDALTALGLGRRLRGLGTTDMIEMLRMLPVSAAEWLDDWFETDALKGALGAGGVTNLCQGPRASGTALVMLHHHVGKPAGACRSLTTARGGIGNLANAIASAARQHGVEIRTGVEVARILVKDERATGVALANGDEIAAKRVVSALDPRRTFLGLIDPMRLEPAFVRAVQNIKYRGVTAKVNLALGELPKFKGLDESSLRGLISIGPSIDYLERAYDDAKYGRVSSQPYLEAVIPSLSDPALAPAGRHVMSIRVQYAPYPRTRREGDWDDARREALGDTVVDTLAGYAPNLKSSILHRQVLTPLDLEERFGLTEGHLYHGEMTLDQILFMRPVPGWAQYRAPIDGLYLCGEGTHPGGGIAGMSGHNAAREILKSDQ
ncbi:MAG TPA: NAD(P)/FAD-dependent oxidoreductase [Anaerolineae bacterium]|nr:NAD(P)/FAD-dependent oxidoreductase [Anaerolineae bacterium]